ncbi:MAG TPA: glycoside hydrolase family 3 N-terminal domain-containing protein, partial [Verrucomicrobiae bacterium]|nr:glycoside hydrolase family 3 N-terminal domain-containing protein [Verrucomicrobiae bacterium]
MRRFLFVGLAAVLLFGNTLMRAAEQGPDIDALLKQLSLDEKIGQMVQIDLSILVVPHSSPMRLDESKLREALVTNHVGALFNNGEGNALSVAQWHAILKECQDMVRADTPHKIPVFYGLDSIHGATYVLGSTLFPQNIAMGATRDPDLVRRCAEISAMETRAAGIRWNFAPVLGVGRQPLWPRLPETFGEDTYLTTVLGAAEVRGLQGNNVDTPTTVAACMKHYLGYTFPWTGKDRSPAL